MQDFLNLDFEEVHYHLSISNFCQFSHKLFSYIKQINTNTYHIHQFFKMRELIIMKQTVQYPTNK